MISALSQLKQDLGTFGLGSLALIIAVLGFFAVAVKPLEERSGELDRRLEDNARRGAGDALKPASRATHEERVAAFYLFFKRDERIEDWLAKLYGIATAAGLELRTADYRLADSRQRIERYRISLPVSGNYTQVRSFIEAALAEIPVLSLDQATFRRKDANEARIDAELVLTLHLLRK